MKLKTKYKLRNVAIFQKQSIILHIYGMFKRKCFFLHYYIIPYFRKQFPCLRK